MEEIERFYLRYFPPGIGIHCQNSESHQDIRMIDLLDLDAETNITEMTTEVMSNEYLINKNPEISVDLKLALERIQEKHKTVRCDQKFFLNKTLRTHLLPLTNVAFDKPGKRFITGSYDRTARVWDVENGTELLTLDGHDNVVFAIQFNGARYGELIATGSFDKTAKIWSGKTGVCLQTLYGHDGEIVSVDFNPRDSKQLATGSMDHTVRLYETETGQESNLFNSHTGEVVSVHFNRFGDLLLTGSFDGNGFVWDLKSKGPVIKLQRHTMELCAAIWNFESNIIATGSLDKTAVIWDIRMILSNDDMTLHHTDEVIDIAFDPTGKQLSTATTDGFANVWCTKTGQKISTMIGHEEEVSKVCFNPTGSTLLTASMDRTARLWSTKTGKCKQILSGHTADVFSCSFNYVGDAMVTASKDNTCKIWR